MGMIDLADFKKLDMRIGKIISAEKIDGTEKLLKLQVDFGSEKRQIVSGLAQYYQPEFLLGKEYPFLLNLAYKIIRGVESQGMILAIDSQNGPVLLNPDKVVPEGAIIR